MGEYDSAAAGDIAVIRNLGIVGPNLATLSFQLNNDDSRPTETARRHYSQTLTLKRDTSRKRYSLTTVPDSLGE